MTNLPARETLGTPMGPRTPVLKRTATGQTFTGCIVDMAWRPQRKKDAVTGVMADVLKPDGKPRQELVLTLLTISSTMPCGIGEDPAEIPAPGTIVRDIIKGQAASQWIDAQKGISGGAARYDVYTTTTTNAVTYDANGTATGAPITTNEQLNAVPRGRSVGIYGDLTVRMYGPNDATWVTMAQAAHMAASREPLPNAPVSAPAADLAPF